VLSRVRKVDDKVAAEIAKSLSTGIVKNKQNTTAGRYNQGLNKQVMELRKNEAQSEKNKTIQELEETLQIETEARKGNQAKIKETKELLAAVKSKPTNRQRGPVAESNSSGKVPGHVRKKKGKAATEGVGAGKEKEDVPILSGTILDLCLSSLVR
jgi:hypothetical protein